jgi:hypothetical protein
MMMQCLIAGGLEASWAPHREVMNTTCGDAVYQPNRGGFYEVPLMEYGSPGWPLQYEGKLIKVMAWGVTRMAPHQYQVVIMRRNPEEMRQSFEAAFGESWPTKCQMDLNVLAATLDERGDCDVSEMDYRQVIEHPIEHFQALAYQGWPIDVERASAMVDPTQYRFRVERLTYGI